MEYPKSLSYCHAIQATIVIFYGVFYGLPTDAGRLDDDDDDDHAKA